MGKQETDISLIRKYLNGELDARAMHKLERRAQDDPFLMDAIEGYQKVKADQQANLDELAGRLDKRIAEKRPRIISFGAIGIAASVLIICSAGVWWLYQGRGPVNNPVKSELKRPDTLQAVKRATDTLDKTMAKSSKQYAGNLPATAPPKTITRENAVPPVIAEDKTVRPPAASSMASARPTLADAKAASPVDKDKNADTTPLNEMIVMNYKSSKKKDTTGLISLHEVRIKTKTDTAPEQRLQANVPGVKVYPNAQSAEDLNRLITRGNLGTAGITQLMTSRVIQGKVIAENNGLPIQGASVKVSGTNQATKTDASGFFKLRADTSHAKLEITDHGYKGRQVSAGVNARDSVKTIALAPDENDDLSETVVTGYTSQPRDANSDYITAHPQKGWTAFKKYLKINAVSPDKAIGAVKVTFSVDKFGSISDIRIIKGLSDAANKKAISLVKDGPDWVGNSNKRPETITLRIKFGE
jgi:hypothetical protein